MIPFLIQVIVGLVGGIAAGLQAPFTGVMGQRLGDMTSVFFTYVGGAILIALIVLFSGGANVSQWRALPWYVLLAGPMGLVIIGSLSYTVPRLGATPSLALFILSWLFFSAAVDHFGWFEVTARPLDLGRLLGILALLIGTWLVVR